MAAVSLLAIGIVPLSREIRVRFLAQPWHMPPGAVAKVVVVTTLLPLTAGVTRSNIRSGARRSPEQTDDAHRHGAAGLWRRALLAGARRHSQLDRRQTLRHPASSSPAWRSATCRGPQPENATVLALSTASRHPAIAPGWRRSSRMSRIWERPILVGSARAHCDHGAGTCGSVAMWPA